MCAVVGAVVVNVQLLQAIPRTQFERSEARAM